MSASNDFNSLNKFLIQWMCVNALLHLPVSHPSRPECVHGQMSITTLQRSDLDFQSMVWLEFTESTVGLCWCVDLGGHVLFTNPSKASARLILQ